MRTNDITEILGKETEANVEPASTADCASGLRVRLETQHSGWFTRERKIRMCVAPGQNVVPTKGLKAHVVPSSTCSSYGGYQVNFNTGKSACLGAVKNNNNFGWGKAAACILPALTTDFALTSVGVGFVAPATTLCLAWAATDS